MQKIGFEIVLFVTAPFLLAIICGIGLIGGITDAKALVPVYLLGLIAAVAVIVMYGVAALFRTVRWLVTNVR